MALEIVRGEGWKDTLPLLDNLYVHLFSTIQRLRFQTVQKRICEEHAAFTEVFIGSILYPLFKWGVSRWTAPTTAAYVYHTIVEPVFVYFVVHEHVPYSSDAALVALASVVSVTTPEILSVYRWALSNYDPRRSRYNAGKTTFLFFPKGTRSLRDLEKDVYIERLRVVVSRMFRASSSRMTLTSSNVAVVASLPPRPPLTVRLPTVAAVLVPAAATPLPSTSTPTASLPPKDVKTAADPELDRIEREFLGFLSADEDV